MDSRAALILCSVLPYTAFASFASATFSVHALLLVSSASVIMSDASARERSMLLWRIPLNPSSSRIAVMLPPWADSAESP